MARVTRQSSQRAAAFCCGFRSQTDCRLGASTGYHLPPRQRSGAAPTDADRHAIFLQQNGQKQAASRAARGGRSCIRMGQPPVCDGLLLHVSCFTPFKVYRLCRYAQR
jgi:hypothetical protein